MRIYNPDDQSTQHWLWKNKSLQIIGVISGMLVWLVGMAAASYALVLDALDEAGHLPLPAPLKLTIALGASILVFKFAKKIETYLDEEVVGRGRITYIRSTKTDASTPAAALAVADKTVDELMQKITDKCKGSTVESRTNLVSQNHRGKYRVTTYVTVLVAGKLVPEDDLPRDLTQKQCKSDKGLLHRACGTYTNNPSGYCDKHD